MKRLFLSLILLVLFSGFPLAETAQAAPDSQISIPAPPAISSSPVPKVPSSQPAEATTVRKPEPPEDIKDAAGLVGEGIKAGKEGKWWYLSSLVCMLIMFILAKVGVFEKIGRWKYAALPVLSIGSALLATFQGGVSWDTATGVLFSSWATGMIEEAWNHGVLKKPHKTT